MIKKDQDVKSSLPKSRLFASYLNGTGYYSIGFHNKTLDRNYGKDSPIWSLNNEKLHSKFPMGNNMKFGYRSAKNLARCKEFIDNDTQKNKFMLNRR